MIGLHLVTIFCDFNLYTQKPRPPVVQAQTNKHRKICVRPNARQVVITAGSPSGIAATAKATAILSSNGGDLTISDPFDLGRFRCLACRGSMLGKSEFRWTAGSQSALMIPNDFCLHIP